MKRGLILLIALLICSYITVAATITETNFREQGYNNIYINNSSYNCSNFDFTFPFDLNGEVFVIFSLNANFGQQPKNASVLEVFLNDDEIIEQLNFRDFDQNIKHIDLPHNKLRPLNTFRVCAKAADEQNQIEISADSFVGVYSGAYFPEKKGFVLELETYSPYVGIPFTLEAVAKNYGTEDAQVVLNYRKSELEENTPEISVLKGETSKIGTVPKCKERDSVGFCTKPGEFTLTYEIVANKAVPFTLLPALMTFKNIFGREQKMFTQRPNLGALEPPHKISVQVGFDKDKLFAGAAVPLKIKVQNISDQRVENITVFAQTGLVLDEESKTISGLNPGQVTEVSFAATASGSGNYIIGCRAEYESRNIECGSTSVTIQEGLDAKLIASIILALLSVVVFTYFYFKKT